MKQKKLLVLAAATALFAACSSNDEAEQATQATAQQEVGFSAYVNRGTTRAGAPGTLSTNGANPGEQSLYTQGFGVFSYYTNGQPYSETSTPDFMYNQQVLSSSWTYSPIKYWPNEFGSSAASEGQDRLTFFAYAPWVEADPKTGRVNGSETEGIVGLTSNTTTGDPYVKYYVTFDPDKRVDLCWGVAGTDIYSYDAVPGTTQQRIAVGEPFIDVLKPKNSTKIHFDFKHALAALNISIDADIDETMHGTSDYLDKYTKIWVRSVSFEGFTDKGKLNLNGDITHGPLWYEISSANNRIGSGSVTVYDGRRDGKEGYTNADASNERIRGLNAQIVQSYPYDPAQLVVATVANRALVTTTPLSGVPSTAAINLFDANVGEPIYVIPTGEDLKVTIVYDVETYDPNLAKYLSDGVVKGSTIENAITKEIKIGSETIKLAAGKKYDIALHLGMNSVKFNATVTNWDSKTADNTYLPNND